MVVPVNTGPKGKDDTIDVVCLADLTWGSQEEEAVLKVDLTAFEEDELLTNLLLLLLTLLLSRHLTSDSMPENASKMGTVMKIILKDDHIVDDDDNLIVAVADIFFKEKSTHPLIQIVESQHTVSVN